jgi:hypothetical protein
VLPFTEKENADGAMFVWFMAHLNGEPYPNAPARSLPAITCFVEVPADSARDGDLAVWPSFVAIYTASVRMVTVVEGAVPILVYDQRFGAPRFLRRRLAQKVDDAIRSACP